uniref:Xylose isomerase-like TIM barrel domain-containing protein n=1 Tax=Micromonas pusilla TaxID=38833 RepID=A0A7S0PKZ1_MICPS|mmetsp:Transcript_10573/g.41303  ORF Transcript_10573/g.41303 Transcript_10573/m.41303 type:complete len:379 (+) Transcript_10573:60-1196(+)
MSAPFARSSASIATPPRIHDTRRERLPRGARPRRDVAPTSWAKSESANPTTTKTTRLPAPTVHPASVPTRAHLIRGGAASSAAASSGESSPLGVHALVWTGGWSAADANDACARTAAAGYDIIEIPLLNPRAVDVEMTRNALGTHGLRVATSLGLSFDADVSSDDASCVARGNALLDEALDVSVGIGATHMCGILYSALGKYPRRATSRGYRNAVAAIKRLAKRAAERSDVALGLEVVNRYETNLLNTATQAMAFLNDVDEPNVVIHLDTYHMNIEERSLEAAVLECGDRLGYVHVGESDRGALGSGNVDFDSLFRGLARVHYRGPITFESFSGDVVSPDLSDVLCIWRNPWGFEQRDELASDARSFVLGMMDKHGLR